MIAMTPTNPAQPRMHVRRKAVSSGESPPCDKRGMRVVVAALVLACAVQPAAAMVRPVACRVVRLALTIVTGVHV